MHTKYFWSWFVRQHWIDFHFENFGFRLIVGDGDSVIGGLVSFFGVDVECNTIHRFSFRWRISRCAFGFCRRRRRFAQRKPVSRPSVCLVRACNRTRARAVRAAASAASPSVSVLRPLPRSSQSHLPNGGRNSCQRRLAFLMGSNRSLEQQRYGVSLISS